MSNANVAPRNDYEAGVLIAANQVAEEQGISVTTAFMRMLANAAKKDFHRKTRTECVRQMFVDVLPNQERNDKPTIPGESAIRLQTRIDAEEFIEKIEALYDNPATIDTIRQILFLVANSSPIREDLHDRLPEFADALADNAVTNEGFAVLFGIDLQKVFDVVHLSNMAKKDGPIVDGKRGKPEGWKAPDVAGQLRLQGWKPLSELRVDEPTASVCEVHGIVSGDGGECVQCMNAQVSSDKPTIDQIKWARSNLVDMVRRDLIGHELRDRDCRANLRESVLILLAVGQE